MTSSSLSSLFKGDDIWTESHKQEKRRKEGKGETEKTFKKDNDTTNGIFVLSRVVSNAQLTLPYGIMTAETGHC
jgi:hypothetical protein